MSAQPRPQPARPVAVRCPDCGQPMVERLNTQTGGSFLGCSAYPTCRGTRDVPTYIKLQREGHAVLPGFEEVFGG